MKNFWNILLISTGILAIGIYFTSDYLATNGIEEIQFDESTDEIALELCNEDRILQYYTVSTGYNGGKKAIKKKLLPIIEKDKLSFGTKNGNITIRFVVNCNGEIGLFRVKSIDENLQETDFAQSGIASLISLVSQLDEWKVKPMKEKKFDSYYFINFKVRNGHVTDIF
ncbi:hypothetical protein JKA74_13925 [Marivirga sp. S37H4]|uniref:Uncharacterized protein n=1 Tax=Marivirga aurantiaca TaxID=2802615 RepID=A0A934WZL5_9BACT|nr:hypothetical protein [Marivirga aurantiaca]MBK6266138.1 hypothetical protein [Marivirga aurantiaca]